MINALTLSLLCISWAGNDHRPNVVFIVSDDQRPDTVHSTGNSVIQTPNLDRLVSRGTVFDRAYTGYPICYASRAQMLTGCFAFRALGEYPVGPVNPRVATLAKTLQSNGYFTWFSGKWHNDGQPTTRGYSATRALYSSGGRRDLVQPMVDDRGRPLTGYRGWTFKSDDGTVDLEKGVGLQPNNSRTIADGAIQAVRESPHDRPFLLHVNFAFPHDPRMWPEGMKDYYQPSQMKLPVNFVATHPFDHGNAEGRDELLLPKPRLSNDVLEELALYYAMVTDMDAQIGRILMAVESRNETHPRPTLILFTSDQGLALGSHGLLGKQNQYEHSIRSPLIISGPGVRSGHRTSALVCLNDLFPTICEYAGIPIPETCQGRSLKRLLSGDIEKVHEYVYGVYTDTQRMICDSRWKLIVYPQAKREQLFDLQSDPDELQDLSREAAQAEKRQQLKAKLSAWCREQEDPLKAL